MSSPDRPRRRSRAGEVAEPLKAFLKSAPALARRDLGRTMGDEGGSYMFQVQWLTGRKANYWHQDARPPRGYTPPMNRGGAAAAT